MLDIYDWVSTYPGFEKFLAEQFVKQSFRIIPDEMTYRCLVKTIIVKIEDDLRTLVSSISDVNQFISKYNLSDYSLDEYRSRLFYWKSISLIEFNFDVELDSAVSVLRGYILFVAIDYYCREIMSVFDWVPIISLYNSVSSDGLAQLQGYFVAKVQQLENN